LAREDSRHAISGEIETIRGLLKELADRGLVVSYYALWHFLDHEGVTFKKKPSRLRTGPAGRRQAA
jgi:hypothetical protein